MNEQEIRESKSLTIANPMYDTVFKRLMKNNCVAKFFIGTLLEEEVISVDVLPQDISIADLDYSICRIPFIVTVKTKEGKHEKLFIDLQKARDENDTIRMWNYLENLYLRDDDVTMSLPIITIYVLGFDLKGINSRCIKVENKYIDPFDNQIIDVKTPFLENSLHDIYIIQTQESSITHYHTKLEQILAIFEQTHFIDDTSKILKRYDLQSDDEDIKLMINILYEMGADPDERKKIEIEIEALRKFYDRRTLRAKEKKKSK
jgi:hypothetical protein